MFHFSIGLAFQVFGFWVWIFFVDQQTKNSINHAGIDITNSWCACTAHQTWCHQQINCQSAESCVSLYEVHVMLLEGRRTSCFNYSKHTFVREVRCRRNSTLFLIKAKNKPILQKGSAIWRKWKTCWILKTFEKPHFSSSAWAGANLFQRSGPAS